MAINGSDDRSIVYMLDPRAGDGLEWSGDEVRGGIASSLYFGPVFEATSPVAAIFHLRPEFDDPLSRMHTHSADAINLVIAGAMKMDGIWLLPGMMKCTPAGVPYGDLVVGPDGVTFIEFLASRSGVHQHYLDDELQAYFERHPHFEFTKQVAAGLREGKRVKPGVTLVEHQSIETPSGDVR